MALLFGRGSRLDMNEQVSPTIYKGELGVAHSIP